METNLEQDFSGGRTDYYLDGPENKSAKVDNLLITKDGTLTVRPGSELWDTAFPRPSGVTSRVGKVFEFNDTVFMIQASKLWRYDASLGWVHVVGPALPTDVAFATSTVANVYSFIEQNNHLLVTSDSLGALPKKIYKDNGGTWRIFTAGFPALSFSSGYPSFTASVAEGKSYLYYFVTRRTYTVTGGVEFQDVGPVHLVQATNMPNMGLGGGRTITIAPSGTNVWPHPANTATEFYDQSNTVIDIYRTKTDQTVGFLAGSVAYGFVGTFVDNKTDAQLGQEIYISGDVKDYDQPPRAKFMTQSQDIVWYGNLMELEGGSYVSRPYRVRQSIAAGPDKCPASFYTDVDGDITAMAAVGDFSLVFTDRKFWRLEGAVDRQGNGFVRKILVSDTVGCISSDSICQSQRGVAFAGNDGFYFTDGYNFTRLSDDLALTYPKLISALENVTKVERRRRICGAYDRATDRYWWAVQQDVDGTDNDSYVIWDANFGVVNNASFTTASSGDDMAPTAGCFIDGNLLRGDRRGYLLVHRDELYNDVRIQDAGDEANWFTKAVPYDYMSSARSMGNSTITKWAGQLQTVFINQTDVSVEAQTCDDDSGDWYPLKEMRFRGHYVWGQAELVWGDVDAIWNYRSFIFFERRFPRGSLRFTYKQVRFKPSYTVILASGDTDLGIVTPLGGEATVTLTGTQAVWDTDYLGYYFHYERDNYDEGFEVVGMTGLTITVNDPLNRLLLGSYKWELRGYRKDERLILKNHATSFEFFGNSQRGWRKTDGAGND